MPVISDPSEFNESDLYVDLRAALELPLYAGSVPVRRSAATIAARLSVAQWFGRTVRGSRRAYSPDSHPVYVAQAQVSP